MTAVKRLLTALALLAAFGNAANALPANYTQSTMSETAIGLGEHTSAHIFIAKVFSENIGPEQFNSRHQADQIVNINITCFAKKHHVYIFNPTGRVKRYPDWFRLQTGVSAWIVRAA
ncbi:MAG: hypothetical protein H6887_11910 [Hoeflea sp.]|nr:hypothetical protein [Hoeflea sp.]